MLAGTERPRFRQDLFAESIDEQGATFVDVMDPDSGRVFRFYEVEFSIACAMDGERDVPGLVKWAQDELGVTPSAHEIQTVIATLGELGYLDLAGAAKDAASDVPATPGLATSGLAAGAGPAADTTVDAPALKAPARTPIPVEEAPPRAAAAPGNVSEVSLDLSEHLAVGREDVQEAVRQSRVMAAVEVPAELAEQASSPAPTQARPERPTPAPEPPARPTPVETRRPAPVAAEAKPPARPTPVPAEAKQPTPVETKQPTPVPVEAKQPTPMPVETKQPTPVPVEAKQPTPVPVETKQPERPVETKQPERPVETKQPEHKAPVTLPKVPEKQPVAEPPPSRTASTVIFVILILVVLGIGGFLVWKLVLDKSAQSGAAGAMGAAPVAPQPAEQQQLPPGPPPKPTFTSKIEMSSGRPKTILSYWPGTVEWVEASGKELKANDVILKLAGYKQLEGQVAALEKEKEKVLADREAAYTARDAIAPTDEAAMKKAQAKIDAAEKAANTKADQLQKKTDQLEKHYVRLNVDGTVTLTRKVGEKIGENAQVATIVPAPEPSATFKIPPNYKFEIGIAMPLSHGERLVTCQVADWEPEKLRISCPPESGVAEGATVTWQIP